MIDKTFNLENGLAFRVETVTDEDPDFSWLGRYTDHPTDEEWAADLVVEREHAGGREYRYFVAPDWEEVRVHVLQDYERMEAYNRGDWNFVGVIATVSFKGAELGNSSLWGIESDSGDDHFLETARDLVHEAWKEAVATLAALKGLELSDEPPALDWED